MSLRGVRVLGHLSSAFAIAMALAACGGGGSGTRADPPPMAPPPTVSPPPGPEPPVVEAPDPAFSEHLAWTGAASAHAAGLGGAGIRVGVIDSGVNREHPALAGQVVENLTYIDPNRNDLDVDDVLGHGTAVAQVIAGQPFGRWPGGLAPGAEIVSARIISDEPPEDDGSGQGNEVNGALGLAPIHQDLIARDVRIMNNSWGGLYWNNAAATAPIAAEYRPFIVDHGGLVVFSAGNSGFGDPSDTAALPSQPGTGGSLPAADLERGWLAVVALAASDPQGLAEYSNACGLAMDYCLAAPGTVVVTGTDDPPDAPEYWRWSGTSFAAPIVSGAAALVWEAFPYFDNDSVRQTLLGTATDIGAPGVDAVFGHGALDVGAAVRGPARLDWGDFTARISGGSSTWGNDLSGDGQLVKRGSGLLVLDADAGNAGGARVIDGSLQVNGAVAGDVQVDADGTFLFGTGVGGDVVNAGRVDVRALESGVLVGTTTVGGDYLHRAGATFAIDVGQRLEVAGRATIEGGDLHVRGVKDGYVHQRREEVIVAGGGLVGTFNEITTAGRILIAGTLGYGPNNVWLDIARLDVTAVATSLPGVTPMAMASATRVEAAFQVLDAHLAGEGGDVDAGFLRLAGELQQVGTEVQATRALSSLSGELHANSVAMTLDSIDLGRRALSARVDGFDGGAHDAGVWKRALGRGGSGGFAGNGFALDGWMIGSDSDLGRGRLAGFAFGEALAHGRVAGLGDRSRDRQTWATAYAGLVRGGGYVLGQAGAGRFERDIERRLHAGEAALGVASRYPGDYAMASVEAGYRFRAGDVAISPYLGAEHVRLHSDGFEERGSGFALRADPASLTRTQATVGLRASRDWRSLRLHAWSEWQQTLQASGFDIQASFTGIDSWSPLPMADAARSGGLVGLGVETWLGRNARLTVGLDQRFGPRGDERMGSVRYVLGF